MSLNRNKRMRPNEMTGISQRFEAALDLASIEAPKLTSLDRVVIQQRERDRAVYVQNIKERNSRYSDGH